ncbi:transcriptional regulator, TetR family [Glycomyces sambucus]|uniref:Transcriptional regulator, TetR family n=1 Tax=Glycomyces sambucus TaxID=380244 RepID=A0A1G9G4Z8_9ACTN|nr:TetR/AcrR family transcriptional regulator [Glycomyces sambucus]SDK95383.1 transcriptional regulator, TetR family [Glycomyces sambucus]
MSARPQILDGAIAMLRAGESLSLESAAKHAGLTKPGLMYHFPTKEALMVALVDRVVDDWEHEVAAQLDGPLDAAAPAERIGAYLEWALKGEADLSDLVMFADPRLCERLTARWSERMRPWLTVPDGLPAPERARLSAVRLIADGLWFADAMDNLPPDAQEREALRGLARSLLEGAR